MMISTAQEQLQLLGIGGLDIQDKFGRIWTHVEGFDWLLKLTNKADY